MKPEYPLKERRDLFKIESHLHDFDTVKSDCLYEGDKICDNILISIVIPVYNSSLFDIAYLSAINQDFAEPYEILVVDNDPISEKVINIIKQYDKGITRYYRNHENIGLFGNWNRCIDYAKSQYIVYLHADDQLHEKCLSRLWNAHLKVGKKVAILGRYDSIEKNNEVISSYENKRLHGLFNASDGYLISRIGLLFGDMCNGCGALMSKEALIEIGGWNPDFHPMSDRVLMLVYADKFGLYRTNFVTRRETNFVSTSNSLWKLFPACAYYLREAVINRYFKNKILWNFYSKHAYIIHSNSYSGFSNDDPNRKPPFVSKLITKIFNGLYRNHDIKLFK